MSDLSREREKWQKYNQICYKKSEEEKRKKYNPDDIFKKEEVKSETIQNQLVIIENKSFIKKIIEKLKSVFKFK